MQSPTTKRLSIVIMLLMLISIAVMKASANPSPDHVDPTNVVDALRYLQDIESKHAQFARPRYALPLINLEIRMAVSVASYLDVVCSYHFYVMNFFFTFIELRYSLRCFIFSFICTSLFHLLIACRFQHGMFFIH